LRRWLKLKRRCHCNHANAQQNTSRDQHLAIWGRARVWPQMESKSTANQARQTAGKQTSTCLDVLSVEAEVVKIKRVNAG
jgi:hypothetical protein